VCVWWKLKQLLTRFPLFGSDGKTVQNAIGGLLFDFLIFHLAVGALEMWPAAKFL